jgi:hypothetical protein
MCHVIPVEMMGSSQGSEYKGSACEALEHGIVLEATAEWKYPNGYSRRRVNRVVELKLGVDPPSANIRVPDGFAVTNLQ